MIEEIKEKSSDTEEAKETDHEEDAENPQHPLLVGRRVGVEVNEETNDEIKISVCVSSFHDIQENADKSV